MEVHITSKQTIKPSSSNIHLLKPFKLSLLDQFSLTHYVPIIFFYTKPFDSQFSSNQLKQSLSKALTQFYPLAGRTKNNLFITDYNEGVPYIEARVNGQLSDLIEPTRTRNELEAMNKLLPCEPYCSIQDYSMIPQLAVQVNVFDCGGIALALCCFHKIIDAITFSAFTKTWTSFCTRCSDDEVLNVPRDLLEAGSRSFPPIESTIATTNTDVRRLFFNKGNRSKRRSFVFDANAIATLKLRARSKRLEHPSRVVALGAFLWKHAIQASRSVSCTSSKAAAVLCQPVNIRRKMNPRLSDYSIGNLFFMRITPYNPVKKDIELTELAYLVHEATESVTGNVRFKRVIEQLDDIDEIVQNAEFYTLNSWLHIIDGEEDFGWGKPVLFSMTGVDSGVGEYINGFILTKARQQHNAIEAWVTLSDKVMCVLEQDLEFLAFVSPSPYLDKSKI